MLNIASSDSQFDKPQRGRPKRAELPDVNINTGAQNINAERAALTLVCLFSLFACVFFMFVCLIVCILPTIYSLD